MLRQVEEFDVHLRSGRLHAARLGGPGPLVVCLPGVSSNLRGFDYVGGALGAGGFQAVAVDLRGRGRSETTPPGTYGWPAHAADVAELAAHLDAPSIDLVGWSMGAYIALQLARTAPGLIRRMVLIDTCAPIDAEAEARIRKAIDRLGVVYPNVAAYLDVVRQVGTISPWDPMWEAYFGYELEPVDGGVRARTSPQAVAEDFEYGLSHDARQLWPGLTMPVLLVRAARPLVPSGPFVVTEADRDALLRSVPAATVVEVEANHYGVMTHPETARAILEFLKDPIAKREGNRS